MFENIIEDIQIWNLQYKNMRRFKRFFYLMFTQELFAVLIFRFGYWANNDFNAPIIRHLFKIIYFFLRKISELIIGVGLWPESEIGPGFKIEHWGGIYIKAKIGKNCRISQQVVIGHIGGFRGGDVPKLGDNVYVGVGAKILGDITIGNNVIVGANSVVLKDIPDNTVAAGTPAKVVKTRKQP